jgi:hypothetical protein
MYLTRDRPKPILLDFQVIAALQILLDQSDIPEVPARRSAME